MRFYISFSCTVLHYLVCIYQINYCNETTTRYIYIHGCRNQLIALAHTSEVMWYPVIMATRCMIWSSIIMQNICISSILGARVKHNGKKCIGGDPCQNYIAAVLFCVRWLAHSSGEIVICRWLCIAGDTNKLEYHSIVNDHWQADECWFWKEEAHFHQVQRQQWCAWGDFECLALKEAGGYDLLQVGELEAQWNRSENGTK